MSARYLEDFSPGYGAAASRAAFVTDAARLDLSGPWAFRFSPTLRVEPDGFESADYDDAHWGRLAVPSHWQLQGYGEPAYLNVSYRFRWIRRLCQTRIRPATTSLASLPACFITFVRR